MVDEEDKKFEHAKEEIEHLNALLSIYSRKLRALELQRAQLGNSSQIQSAIQDTEEQLVRINLRLYKVSGGTATVVQADHESSRVGCTSFIFSILLTCPGVSIIILLALVAIIANFISFGIWFLVIAASSITLAFAIGKYITSQGSIDQIKEARTTISSFTLGLISTFLGFSVAIVANIFANGVAQALSGDRNFVIIIISLIVGLMGVIASVYLYVTQREIDTQQEIKVIREAQNIVTEGETSETVSTKGSL